jgi:DNA polymerase
MTLPPGLDQALQQLSVDCAACCRCPLVEGRRQVVVGRGNPRARLMLIGEAPGAQEDALGLPFVGRSGQLLDQLLAQAGLDPDHDLYICNVVKCRPPQNRKPTPQEMQACRGWLEQQIALVDPALILLAGASALQALLGIRGGISRLRGEWQPWQERWLMPIFHPSYLLRYPSVQPGSPRALTLADLQAARQRLAPMPQVL